ncbi:hypothetical protein [Mycobacteroides abscessus]|uniref:hypothetical protein n=1 Tax=Mycobacteroides abscessus TaxID=36809 RepID=UPI00092A8357|nr:hypothetical protein [Mycobacteroides abscessus]MDO3338748.1 hypothetical protein [Mycobacteroides abscessus subsp. abscessus]QOF27070.1 hypothetical protein E3G43_000598 [Mycobacteroides abscessus]RIQ97247.1 hypothetical protein D2E35_22805 [Mycobacteroides abscessus]RIR37734.1 hypothetical protein D2E38_09435 [Mycobacteroides abscessus]RIR45268.1 hypothetical protein D2E36_02470 [Mycobacteroides abscessus]
MNQPQQVVRSRTGSIAVVTTERGLPTAIKIDQRELSRSPQALATEILDLCKLSAIRQQVARRKELQDHKYAAAVCRALDLASEADLAAAEEKLHNDDDDLPDTWLRSV